MKELKLRNMKIYELADELQYERKYFYRAISQEPTPRLKRAIENYFERTKK